MRQGDRAITYLAATTLLLFAPFASTLHANHYPLASPEVLLVLAACFAAGAAMAFTVRLGGRQIAALVLGALAALSIDLLFDMTSGSGWMLVALTLTCLVLAWILRHNIALILLIASAVLIATTLGVPATAAVQAFSTGQPNPLYEGDRKALPVILHLILDEHSGIDGLPKDLAGSEKFARWLTAFYVQRGFRVFTGAYSEYADTHEAIPNLLNFASRTDDRPYLVKGKSRPYQLTHSVYFALLSRMGYRFHVYQSDYMDFCQVAGVSYSSCHRYSAHDMSALRTTPISTAERAQFLVNSQIERSHHVRLARRLYQRIDYLLPALPLPAWELTTMRVGPIPVLPVLERLEQDVRSSAGGHVYFAHLLIPHYPFVLDENCQVRPEIEEWLYGIPILPEETSHWPRHELEQYLQATRAQRYERYFEQIRCQQKWLDRLFDALIEVDPGALIIVHGDHGSRIARRPVLNWDDKNLSFDDFGDAYSTLFAVRCAGNQPGASRGTYPLQELLGKVFALRYSKESGSVYLRQSDGTKKLSALPHVDSEPTEDLAIGTCISGLESSEVARNGNGGHTTQ
jgi:hypothetical protein